MTSFLALTTFCVFLVADAAFYNFENKVAPSRRQQQHKDTFVAFSAGLTHHVNQAAHTTIAFNRVWTNKGNGYDNTTGIFTCPHTGVYIFYFHALTENAGSMWLELYKNHVYETSSFAHNTADYAYASNSVVLPLIDGDQVYISAHGTSKLSGDPDEIYATFSGYNLMK